MTRPSLPAGGQQARKVRQLVAVQIGNQADAHALGGGALDVEPVARVRAVTRPVSRPDEGIDQVLPALVDEDRNGSAADVVEPGAGENDSRALSQGLTVCWSEDATSMRRLPRVERTWLATISRSSASSSPGRTSAMPAASTATRAAAATGRNQRAARRGAMLAAPGSAALKRAASEDGAAW